MKSHTLKPVTHFELGLRNNKKAISILNKTVNIVISGKIRHCWRADRAKNFTILLNAVNTRVRESALKKLKKEP